jgi:hypothetical protein
MFADFEQKGPKKGRASEKLVFFLLFSQILGNTKKILNLPHSHRLFFHLPKWRKCLQKSENYWIRIFSSARRAFPPDWPENSISKSRFNRFDTLQE